MRRLNISSLIAKLKGAKNCLLGDWYISSFSVVITKYMYKSRGSLGPQFWSVESLNSIALDSWGGHPATSSQGREVERTLAACRGAHV